MQIITLFHKTFPGRGSPNSASLIPYPTSQKHTYTVGTEVFEATFHESRVEVPDGATVDQLRNVLCWSGANGKMKSTAAEVLSLAQSRTSGFRASRAIV